jgi:putative heme transporter
MDLRIQGRIHSTISSNMAATTAQATAQEMIRRASTNTVAATDVAARAQSRSTTVDVLTSTLSSRRSLRVSLTAAYSTGVMATSDGSTTYVVSLSARSAVRIAVALFVAFFALELARNIPDTLTRVVLGAILAFALDPVVRSVQGRLGCSRAKAILLVGTIAASVFGLLVSFVGPRAIAEAQNFGTELPATVDKLVDIPVVGSILDRVDAPERLRDYGSSLPSRLDTQALTDLVETLVGGVVAGLTVIVVGIAVLIDGEVLVRRMRQLVPQRHRPGAAQIGNLFRFTVGKYFAGSILVASMTATFVLTVGLILGVPLAPVAALWVLVVSLIPQIGGFLSGSFFALLGFAESPGTGVACALIYIVWMNIENHVIQPVVVGKAVDLSAPATMLAALIGAASAGIPGAIVATPLVGTAKALYLELWGNKDIVAEDQKASEEPKGANEAQTAPKRLRAWLQGRNLGG